MIQGSKLGQSIVMQMATDGTITMVAIPAIALVESQDLTSEDQTRLHLKEIRAVNSLGGYATSYCEYNVSVAKSVMVFLVLFPTRGGNGFRCRLGVCSDWEISCLPICTLLLPRVGFSGMSVCLFAIHV